MELKGLKINFLGDSITQGIGASSAEKVYHALLKESAELREAKNYGISGTRIARQTAKPQNEEEDFLFNNAFCDRYILMDDDADAVVVYGGVNDFSHGDAPLGGFSDRNPDTFYGACHVLFCGLAKKYLGKTVVIMTPLHTIYEMTNTGIEGRKPAGYGTLKEYVDIIKEVAAYYALPVLDLFSTIGIQPAVKELKDYYIPDGIHPNDNGHEVIARRLENFLKSL